MAGFIVTDEDEEEYCEGLPVLKVDKIKYTDEDGVIISVSEKLQKEIAAGLLKLGVGLEHIYGQKMICTNDGALINLSGKFKNYSDDNGDFFSRYKDLDKIGLNSGTDKSSRWHNYLSKYEFFLEKYRTKQINVLELGVLDGNSLRLWKDYFTYSQIYGVDIDPKCSKHEDDRIKILVGDLDDYEFVHSLSDIKPSIIIEDASHTWNQQILTFCTLYGSLPSGGIYILEDIETSFSSWRHRGYDNAIVSGYEMCEAIAKVVTSGEFLNSREESAAIMNLKDEIYEAASQTAMVSYIHGSCIFIRN